MWLVFQCSGRKVNKMGFGEFFIRVMTDPIQYVVYLLLCEIIVFSILRKQLISIIDPLAVSCFFLGIYSATVLYMYANNLIEEISVYHFLLSTTALIIGLCFWKRARRIKSTDIHYSVVEKYLYQVSAISFVLIKIYLLGTLGAPLLSGESRIGFYQTAGTIMTVSGAIQSLLYFLILEKCLRYKQITVFDKLLILFLFVDLFLSGSKSAFSTLLFSLNVYIFYFSSQKLIDSKYIVMLIPIFMFIIMIQSNNDVEIFFDNILYSIMDRADVYVNFYGAGYSNILNYFKDDEGIDNLFLNMFQLLLNRFGIIPYDDVLLRYTWADKMSIYIDGVTFQGGVNNVYNLFSLTYIGFWGSIIYSFFIGLFVSFIRNRLYLVFNLKYVMVRFFIYDMIVHGGHLISMIHGFVVTIITDFIIVCLLYMLIYYMVHNGKYTVQKGDA